MKPVTKIATMITLAFFGAWSLNGCYYDEVATYNGIPTNVSFENDVLPILQQNCITSGCHDEVPTHAPSMVPENAYSALIQGNFVNPLDPQSSIIYQEIAGGGMPPTGPISVNDQKIILGWITDGAKNN